MEDDIKLLRTAFAKNRAEEWGYDVWDHFVVPPFYEEIISESRKPRVFIAGRGCGKTMLLRYLCHQSVFSSKRAIIPKEAFSKIGLYWRIDTSSVVVMNERDIKADVWHSAFEHLITLTVGLEIIKSVHSIINSNAPLLDRDSIKNINFNQLTVFDPSFDIGFQEIATVFNKKLSEFSMWISNVRKHSEPNFLGGKQFLLTLISQIKEQIPALRESIYYVYIDEFESLLEYQQRIINTLIKQSELPLIFNIAMKRNGFLTQKTIGKESIVNGMDYDEHDIEQLLSDDDFKLFAAEVLCLNLTSAGFEQLLTDPQLSSNPELLLKRRDNTYKQKVLGYVRTLFPGISNEELAVGIFDDETLGSRLQKDITKALEIRKSKVPMEKFYRRDLAQASVVASALLYRDNLEPENIARELDMLQNGGDNQFTGKTDWLHNNFVGCLLKIYSSYPRACPFYAGFDTFCQMAKGNMRHFLKLCHKSINQALRRNESRTFPVTLNEQAIAARQTSMEVLNDVRCFGELGHRLYTFALGLGSLFALAHSQPSQSEPERCHFSLRDELPIIDEFRPFIEDAIKWSVLFEERETKRKDSYQPEGLEYILNPIYSPYFHISYRKGRNLKLSSAELRILIEGDYSSIKELLRKQSSLWAIELRDTDPTLFSHLLKEND